MIVSITRISDSKTQQFSIRQNDPHHSRMVFTQLSQAAVAFGNKSDVLIRFGTGPCPTQKEIDRLLEKFQWHRMGCRALRNPIVDSKQLFLEHWGSFINRSAPAPSIATREEVYALARKIKDEEGITWPQSLKKASQQLNP